MREAFFLFIVVAAGTGGELCVTRAMKHVGEVTDFRPLEVVRVIARAMKVPWMWIGVAMMALAFFSLLAMLSIENVSFVVPVTALSNATGAPREFLSRRTRVRSPLGGSASRLYWRHARLARQALTWRAAGCTNRAIGTFLGKNPCIRDNPSYNDDTV
jgi:hypothetical protein